MRLGTAQVKGQSHFVFSFDGKVFYLWEEYARLFGTDKLITETRDLLQFVKRSEALIQHLQQNQQKISNLSGFSVGQKDWLLPFTPVMFRDFYCFEEHVSNARKGRGLEMIPEWYQAPIFYYSNHLSFRGPFEELPYPRDCQELDLELEIAAVIGKEIYNATVEEARDAILGYCLVNDWTARDFQRFEMKVNMGPTKGKDFATTFGSFIVTKDEIESLRVKKGYDIQCEALINGETLTKKSWGDIQFSFEEMLVRGSKNCRMYPGEVIASGTMGGGCLMEHNVLKNEKRWLKKGDVVTLKWLNDGPMIENRIGEER